MSERLTPQQSPGQSIEKITLSNPDFHFLSNFHNYTNYTDTREQYKYIEKLREKYGEENVKISLAIIDGEPTAVPEMFGIYVDAKKWAEQNQSDSIN